MNKIERDKLIMSYSNLVRYKIRQINKVNDPWVIDNLYQEGMLAVCKAVDSYTHNETYTLLQAVSFAVRARLCRYIRRYNSIIPIKHNSDTTDRAINMLRKVAGTKDITYADIKRIATKTETDIDILQDASNIMSAEFLQTEEIQADDPTDKYFNYRFVRQLLKHALPRLTEVEKEALACILQDKPLTELARHRGVSKQASQEACRRGIKKLRVILDSKNVQFSDII